MYEGSASTRCGSAAGRAMANTSIWSPPTLLAIDARSSSEAATRTFAWAVCGAKSAATRTSGAMRRGEFTMYLLELMSLVGAHGIEDAESEGVDRMWIGAAAGGPGHEVLPAGAE